MNIRYYIDPATEEPHIYRHGLEESEVEDVLETRLFDFSGREGTRVAYGQTTAGRYLKVVYISTLDPDSMFVITAYELRGKELRAYRRLRRRKSGKRK